jgi:hypothetical protein
MGAPGMALFARYRGGENDWEVKVLYMPGKGKC